MALDVALLAGLDALHGTLSGAATKCLMRRAVWLFGNARYERLAPICGVFPGPIVYLIADRQSL